MSWIDGLRERLRPFWRRTEAERGLEDEFAFHLERETAKNRAAGMTSPRVATPCTLTRRLCVEKVGKSTRPSTLSCVK